MPEYFEDGAAKGQSIDEVPNPISQNQTTNVSSSTEKFGEMQEMLGESESKDEKNEEETQKAKNWKYQNSSGDEIDLNDSLEYYAYLKKDVKANKSKPKQKESKQNHFKDNYWLCEKSKCVFPRGVFSKTPSLLT